MLRTPGHKGFITPRAESPHGRKHHKDQQAPRTAEPHRQESRTGRTGAGELSAYGTKLRQQPKPAREERPQGTQEGQKTTRDGKTAREAGPQGLDDLVGSQSRKKCGIQEAGNGREGADVSKAVITTAQQRQKPEVGIPETARSAEVACDPPVPSAKGTPYDALNKQH